MSSLDDALRGLAATPDLLVAIDYDGVLAPIVADPSAAVPLPSSVAVLIALASAPRTQVAVVSGRAVADLAALSGLPPQVHLVGSHGSEFSDEFGGFGDALTPERLALREQLGRELIRLAHGAQGVLLEHKPVSVAVHVRNAPSDIGERLLSAVSDGPATWPGVQTTAGKKVLELAVLQTSKGTALDLLRDRLGATAVFFAGDDVTDEKAFARLRDGDVGVKVGPGDTLAEHRVAGPPDVTLLLQQLLAARTR